jgi:hypothetical protein
MTGVSRSWTWLLGRPKGPAAKEMLSAGPLTAVLSGLDLLDIRFGETEVIRRLGVRVRDKTWGTVPAARSEVHARSYLDHFRLRIRARHEGPGIDFTWEANIVGKANGVLVCDMAGEALSECSFNRIGLIILHPLTLAGRPFFSRNGNSETKGIFPSLVGPQMLVDGIERPLIPAFDHLAIVSEDGVKLTFDVTGDLFETEDQRNWTDGSFKTYSTPLSIAIPQVLQRGGLLKQSLRFAIESVDAAPPARARTGHAVLRLDTQGEATVPAIGISLDGDGHEADEAEIALLRLLAPAHVRAEIACGGPGVIAALAKMSRTAKAIGAPLELVLTFPTALRDIEPALDELMPVIARLPLARILLLPAGDAVTPGAWLSTIHSRLPLTVPLVIGTGADFVELNRSRPAPPIGVGLTYAVNPQVHDTDEDTLVQSLQGQAATISAARKFAPGAPICVGPITLKPRTSGPNDIDPRLASAFGAAWTLGSAKYLGEAGAAALTYFEATGWRGIIARRAGTTLSPATRPGDPYPVYHTLRALGRLRGVRLVDCISSRPGSIEALAARGSRTLTILIAMLVPQPDTVKLLGLPEGRYELRLLARTGWTAAGRLKVRKFGAVLHLGPFATAMLTSAVDHQATR